MEIKNTTFRGIRILQQYITYEHEDYLKSVRNISFRKELTKLRISNHILLLEKGRYYTPKIPSLAGEERLCPICFTNSIESESHFLFDCAFYNEEKKDLNSKLTTCSEKDIITMNTAYTALNYEQP